MQIIKNKKSGVMFAAITLIWTWGVLAVPIICGLDFANIITKISYVLMGASPSVIALIFVFFSGDRVYKNSFLKRIVSLGSVRAKGLAAIFLLVPTVTVLSACIDFLITSTPLDTSVLSSYLQNPAGLIMFAAFTLVFGPLAEEIGWRGYLLDCLKKLGPLVYGVGIGLIWAIWHLPMFFIAGTYQNGLFEQGLLLVLCFFLSTTALGVIIGEIAKKYNSILAAILFHFMINFTGELIPLSISAELIKLALYILIAVAIIGRYYHMKNILVDKKLRIGS